MESITRRDFLKTTGVVTGAIGLAPTLSAPFASAAFAETKTRTQHGDGHLYMQTNETQNAVIHYLRSASGTLTEVERISTGGSGSGVFRPLYQANGPNAYEAAGGVILTPDRRFLLTTNGIDNSVSSFGLGEEGQLTLLDVKPTGNTATGRTGSPAKSLAYAPSTGTLFVLHAFGPDHLRLMSLDGKGKLTTRPERYSINTPNKTDRVTTMTALSPNEKFLLVGTNFDERPWPKPDGTLKLVGSNAPDPDGVVIFPVGGDGTLGAPSFQDGGGGSPFYIAFLHTRPDTFIIGTAVGDGLVMSSIDTDGRIHNGPLVRINSSAGEPSELCWLAISPDDRSVFATLFGYSYISSYRIDGTELAVAKDPACPKVPGDGTFRTLNGNVNSGPADLWMTPDGAYLYQIYGNASKLVGYAIQPDLSLNEITSVSIPYNSPVGLAGF
jgi:hypothetical protein